MVCYIALFILIIGLSNSWLVVCKPFTGPLARRLFQAPANSVPSERSISVMNFIHKELRNRLTPQWVNKLQYVYNQLTLRKMGVQELSNRELVEVEENWAEKSQNTAKGGGDDSEVEDFEDITWVDDVIETE